MNELTNICAALFISGASMALLSCAAVTHNGDAQQAAQEISDGARQVPEVPSVGKGDDRPGAPQEATDGSPGPRAMLGPNSNGDTAAGGAPEISARRAPRPRRALRFEEGSGIAGERLLEPMTRRGVHEEAHTLPMPLRVGWHPLHAEISGTVSVGNSSTGYISGQAQLPAFGKHHRIMEEHQGRNTAWGTDELVAFVEMAAAEVAKAIPDSVLMVGNLSVAGGGDMPWSVSHNTGRDVDLCYYLVDEQGRPFQPRTLVMLDASGSGELDGQALRFDAARNWALVKAMVGQQRYPVQYVFVYEPLIKMMLAEARKEGFTKAQEKAIRAILRQPMGAQPHADHMHVRIWCSKEDIAYGCRDMVAGKEVIPRDDPGYVRTVGMLLERLSHSATDSDGLAAAWRTLGLMKASQARELLKSALESPCTEPLCLALMEAAQELSVTLPTTFLAQVVDSSLSYESVKTAMGFLRRRGPAVVKQAIGWLASSKVLQRDMGPFQVDLPVAPQAALLLGWSGSRSAEVKEALLLQLSSETAAMREAALWSLEVLYVGQPLPKERLHEEPGKAVEVWRAWIRENPNPTKNLRQAMKSRGIRIADRKKFDPWELIRAVETDDYVSMEAQRQLATLMDSKRIPELSDKRQSRRYWKGVLGETKTKSRGKKRRR